MKIKIILIQFISLILLSLYLAYYYYFESDKISYIKTIGALSLALAFIVALINKLKHNDSSKWINLF